MAAWTTYYKRTQPLTWGHDDPYGYACMSIKAELIYNGYVTGVDPTSQVLGLQSEDMIKAFQKDHGLTSDGIVGPATAQVLYRKRSKVLENQYDIPNDYLCKLKSLESANDPGAVGSSDPDDHGLVQINLRYHPDVTLQQAEDGEYSLSYAARTLNASYNNLKDWDAAIASWNVGSYWATNWLKAGKPATGSTYYARATSYVTNVKKQSC